MAAPPTNTPGQGMGVVWNVMSGDTIEVCSGVAQGKPTFQKITIAGINAPRLGIKTPQAATADEPMAWEAREFLRKTLLSKKVQYRQLYEAGNRAFFEVRTPEDKAHLGVRVAAAGFGRVAANNNVKSCSFYPEIEAAEQQAAQSGLGIHSAVAAQSVRNLVNVSDPEFDVDGFMAENKFKVRTCVVDHIRDASNYRVVVCPEGEDSRYVSLQLALSGVQNPTFKFAGGGVEEESIQGNGAFYAKTFAQERILCREMKVRLESIERKGPPGNQTVQFIGSLIHPAKGSIAEFFLDGGFGVYVDWSAQNSASGPQALRNSQKSAQDKRLRRWKNWDGTSDGMMESFEFNGKVTEVCSGDVLRIVDTDSPQHSERRYYLASVRAPPMARGQDMATSWAPASTEFMRKKTIGKTFKVRLEYKKNISVFGDIAGGAAHPPPSDEKTGDMYYVTLTDGNKYNIIFDALKEGLVKVEQVRSNNDSGGERARDYDEMCVLEKEAQAAKKGQWKGSNPDKPEVLTELILQQGDAAKGNKPRGPTTKKELTERAKAFEPQLVAKKNGHEAIVQYIMNGSRMRLKLIHEKLLITFQCDGVKAPNADRGMPASKGLAANVPRPEPFGNESLQMARELCMQQEVRVVIKRCDPAGAFCGQIFLPKRKEDLALQLLEKGLAYCDGWNMNQGYQQAESRAKKEKLGYWSVVEDESPVQEEKSVSGTAVKGQISHIEALDEFYLTVGDSQRVIATEVAKAQSAFQEQPPMKRTLCLAQHWEDKKWYRARFEGKGAEGAFAVFLVDYGSRVEVNTCKRIDPGHQLLKMEPAVMKCGLYGVKTTEEYWEKACETFFKMTDGKSLSGTVEKTYEGVNKVVLHAGAICINEKLIQEALARLTKRENKPTSAGVNYENWKKLEQVAKRNHTNIWRYGDVGSDDEE